MAKDANEPEIGYRTIGNPRPAWWKGEASEDALAMALLIRDERAKHDHKRGMRVMSLRQMCDAYDELIEKGYAEFVEFPDGGLGLELTREAIEGGRPLSFEERRARRLLAEVG